MRKTTILTLILISLSLIGCKSSSNNNETNKRNSTTTVTIKKAKPKYDQYSAKQISQMSYEKSLRLGLSYYSKKKYSIALPFFKKASGYNKGEAYYHLGNTLLKLKQYEQAASTYQEAYYDNYKKQKTLFKMASAYSLGGDPENALLPLLSLLKHIKGSQIINKINKDTNFKNFRNSKYYQECLDNINFCHPGITPKTKAEFIQNMLFGEAVHNPNFIMSSDGYHFRKNGLYNFFPNQANAPQQFVPEVGIWEIDKEETKIIIKYYSDTWNYSKKMYKKVMEIKTVADFKKANFPKIKTLEILFKNMHLNIKSIYIKLYMRTYSKCEKVIMKSNDTDERPLTFGRFLPIDKR